MSAQGEDRSSYQTVHGWSGLDFGFCKATEGLAWYDPTFKANWSNLAHAGIARGAYHFFHPGSDPIAQARFFVGKVKAQGIKPGDMLVGDIEILSGGRLRQWFMQKLGHMLPNQHCQMRAVPRNAVNLAAATFLDEVQRLAPDNPVLVYTNFNVGSTLTSCHGYELWVADPASVAPDTTALWGKPWRFWQWGTVSNVDKDAYNGSVADMKKWLAGTSYKGPYRHQVGAGNTQSLAALCAARNTTVAHIYALSTQHLNQENALVLHSYLTLDDALTAAGHPHPAMPEGLVYYTSGR